jgi:hypothetical protein
MTKAKDFKMKSDESNEAGKFCKANKHFSAAINRYYYSLLQLMLYILDSRGIPLSEADKQISNTHELTKNKISSLLIANSGISENQFRGDFKSIKGLRQQADYERIDIILDDCNQMEKNIQSMRLYLNKLIEEKK